MLNRAIKRSGLVSLFVITTACGALDKQSGAFVTTANGRLALNDTTADEKIIGDNDLTPVLENGANIPEKYRPLINAFGMMNMGCTATHIGNGIAITAGHCFQGRVSEDRQDNVPCGTSTTIKWGFRKDAPEYLTSKCVTILALQKNKDRDYAIFTLDNVPGSSVEVDLSARPIDKTAITIFGFPQKRPLEWSKTCVVRPGSVGKWGSDMFSHQCDTEPGNSGSTVIDDTTRKVVGIHDGGIAPWNYGTYLVNTPLAEILSKQ
jgi:V8-like Glu-specific endopeptidase